MKKTRKSPYRLRAEVLESRLLLASVLSESPAANSLDAPTTTDVSATFDEVIAAATDQTFLVRSRQGGDSQGTITISDMTVTLAPSSDFFPGDIVEVTATAGIQGATSGVPRAWQFRTATSPGGVAQFADSGQNLGTTAARDVEFGDLDGDGDLDSVEASEYNIAIWMNDGSGVFTSNGQNITGNNQEFELGDIDRDGDLDLVTTNGVFSNDGSGVFSATGQSMGGFFRSIGMGDVDSDGDLDVLRGVPYGGDRVWLNDGNGVFSDTGQTLGFATSDSIQLGDLDADGDLDAFTVYYGADNRVWVNDGSGIFTDSGQAIGGFSASKDVDIGDLDGDGDLDALISNDFSTNIPSQVWLNDGSGVFSDTGQALGNSENNWSVELGDLDGDGDLDAFMSTLQQASLILLNDGAANFTDTGQSLPATRETIHVALADVDGDGDLDAWEANNSNISRLMLNVNPNPTVTLSVDNITIPEATGTAAITSTLSAPHSQPVTVNLAVSGSAATTDDYTISGTEIVIPTGSITASVTVTAVQDVLDDDDETIIIDVTEVVNGQEAGQQQVTITIIDDDAPAMPDVTLTVDETEIAEAGGVATLAVLLSEPTTIPVTAVLNITGTAGAADYTASATEVVVAPGSTTGTLTVSTVDDDVDEPDETVVVEIVGVTGGQEAGEQQQTITIIDNDAPPSFAVASMTPAPSGFRVEFANPLDASDINLYDTQNANMGAADVVVTGATSGPISGSIVIEETAVTFIKSGDPLAEDNYTVMLRSAEDGFKDSSGALLDGNGDGTAGDDYVADFTVDAAPVGARTVSIPDFVRGPGQSVNLPADTTAGIPISISDGTEVRAIDLRIRYDPALLEITDATAPAGGTVVLNTTTPGLAILVYFNTEPLPAGESTFMSLEASIPTDNASASYGIPQLLDIHGVIVGDGNDNEFPVVMDDALHLASFFSDVSGNGRTNAADASQVARFAALIDRGFIGALNADPIVVGDVSGNGRINAADASLVARFAALLPVDQIPDIPAGVLITGVTPLLAPDDFNTPTAKKSAGPILIIPEPGGDSSLSLVELFWSEGSEADQDRAIDEALVDEDTSLEDAIAELLD